MYECTNQIRFFKVTTLPAVGVPNAIYLLLSGGVVRQYVTDNDGTIYSAPSMVETITTLSKSGTNLIYTNEAGSNFIIGFSPVAFSGLYTDLVGSPTNTSSFTNNGDGTSPYATLADIPTDLGDLTINFDIASSLRFSPGDQTVLELVDRNGVVLSSVLVTPANIAGLANYTGFDTRYYRKTELNDFFAGNTPITGYNKALWDEAHSWGDHSLAGYLTSFSEQDPIFLASVAAGITSLQVTNWDIAYSWGNHATAGYLKNFTEVDPLFSISPAAGIDVFDISNWDNAFSWGNHALAGYAEMNATNAGSLEITGTLEANQIVKTGGTSSEVLLADGSTAALVDVADKTFTYVQAVPSAVWNITHNLNKYPAVTIIDSANTKVIGDIEYVDANNVTLTFSAGFSGRAEFN